MLHSQQGVLAKIRRNKTRTAGTALLLIVTSLGLGLDFLGYSLSHLVLSLFGAGQWALSAAVWQTALVSTAMAFGIGSIAFLAYVVVRKIRNRGPEKPKTVSVKGVEALKEKIKELELDTGDKKQIVSIQYKHPTETKTIKIGHSKFFDTNCPENTNFDSLTKELKKNLTGTGLLKKKTKFTITYKNPDAKLTLKGMVIKTNRKILKFNQKDFLKHVSDHEKQGFTVSKIVFINKYKQKELLRGPVIYKTNRIENKKLNLGDNSYIKSRIEDSIKDEAIDEQTDFIVYLTPPQGKAVAKVEVQDKEKNYVNKVRFVPIEYPMLTLAAEELSKYEGFSKNCTISVNGQDEIPLKEAAKQRNICGVGPGYNFGEIKITVTRP